MNFISYFIMPQIKLRGEIFGGAKDIILGEETKFYAFNSSLYAPVSYLPQSMGIAFARLFTDRIILLYYAGRIFNALLAGAMFFSAVRIAPRGKYVIILISMLPNVVQAVDSFSVDGLIISLVILFIAFVLCLREKPWIICCREFVVIYMLIFLISLIKTGYFPVFLFLLVLPECKFMNRRSRLIHHILFVLFPLILMGSWGVFTSCYLTEIHVGVDGKAQA